MPRCTWTNEVERYFDGQSKRPGEVAQHLAECDTCRAHNARLERMRNGFRALLQSPPELSDGQFPAFVRTIQDRLDAPLPRRSRWWTWASLTAAALVVAVATFVLFNNGAAPVEATVVESCSTDIEGASVTSYKPDTGVTTVWVTVSKDDVW